MLSPSNTHHNKLSSRDFNLEVEMSIYLPPIARKKKVERLNRDSKSKIFNTDLTNSYSMQSRYKQDFPKHNAPPAELRITSPARHNKPQSTDVTFNWKNSRFLCEPICYVSTEAVKNKQANWWPAKIPEDVKPQPSYSLDSTSRSDFQPVNIAEYMKTRHEETQRLIQTRKIKARGHERISYQHKYNSRIPNNQPEHGKLHGSFINGEVFT